MARASWGPRRTPCFRKPPPRGGVCLFSPSAPWPIQSHCVPPPWPSPWPDIVLWVPPPDSQLSPPSVTYCVGFPSLALSPPNEIVRSGPRWPKSARRPQGTSRSPRVHPPGPPLRITSINPKKKRSRGRPGLVEPHFPVSNPRQNPISALLWAAAGDPPGAPKRSAPGSTTVLRPPIWGGHELKSISHVPPPH